MTQFGYSNSILTSITDPLGNTTTIAYNDNGQDGIGTNFGYTDSNHPNYATTLTNATQHHDVHLQCCQ